MLDHINIHFRLYVHWETKIVTLFRLFIPPSNGRSCRNFRFHQIGKFSVLVLHCCCGTRFGLAEPVAVVVAAGVELSGPQCCYAALFGLCCHCANRCWQISIEMISIRCHCPTNRHCHVFGAFQFQLNWQKKKTNHVQTNAKIAKMKIIKLIKEAQKLGNLGITMWFILLLGPRGF